MTMQEYEVEALRRDISIDMYELAQRIAEEEGLTIEEVIEGMQE